MALTAVEQAQVDQLKKFIGDAIGTYTDEQLIALLTASDSFTVASNIWSEYAASTATLIDMSEGSSSRKLGSLYAQAQKMSAHFADLVPVSAAVAGATTTSKISRP